MHRIFPYIKKLALMALLLAGCAPDDNVFEKAGPEIRPLVPVDIFKQERGLPVSLGIELRAISGLNVLQVTKDGQPFDQVSFPEDELIFTYEFLYEVESLPDGTLVNFEFQLTDQAGIAAPAFSFSVEVGPPFSVEDEQLGGTPVKVVRGRINRDTTFRSEHTYLIDGLVSVEGDKTLTIEAGTTVLMRTFNDPRDSRLVITQGSRLNAVGTKDAPIVFTSDRTITGGADWGDWAGIFLYGRAPTNQGASIFEEGFTYGGNNFNDNSGEMRYVRIEYAGRNDADAIQFYGVGASTRLSHICVWNCFDNAVRFKGGGADLKYLVVIDHGAYGLWAEHGWRGRGQFWVFQTDIAATIIPVNFNNIARSVELRTDNSNYALTPLTYGYLSNMTLIGNGNTDLDGTRRGFRCRTGAQVLATNFIVTNYPDDGVRVEDVPQEKLDNGTVAILNVRSFSNRSDFDELAEDFFLPNPDFNVSSDPVRGITPQNFVGSVPSPLNPATDSRFGSWFTPAPFIGAVENAANDWTADGVWVRNQDGSIR